MEITLTAFVQSNGPTPCRRLMFVQEAEGVAEFVKNGAAIVGAEGGAEVVDPAEIHRRLFGFDAGVLPAT